MNYRLLELGFDPEDPEIKGRLFDSYKGRFKSRSSDPWMQSQFIVDKAFLDWLVKSRRQKGMEVDLANLKAEIRNDFVRAKDLWDDYSIAQNEKLNLKNRFLSYESLERQELSLKEKKIGENSNQNERC